MKPSSSDQSAEGSGGGNVNVTQVKMSAAGERTLIGQLEDIRTKIAKSSQEVQDLIDRYNTLPDAIKEATDEEYNKLVKFRSDIQNWQQNYKPVARLRQEDMQLLLKIGQLLTFDNFSKATDVASEKLKAEEEAATKRLAAQGKEIETKVGQMSADLSKEREKAKEDVRNSLSWLQWIAKNKVWTIVFTVLVVCCIVAGGVNSCVRGDQKAAAAEQVIQDANYWDVFEYYYPSGADKIKQNYKQLQEKRTTKEAQKFINGK